MMNVLARVLSWRSSLIGVFVLVSSTGALLTAVGVSVKALIDGDPSTVPDWGSVTTAATAVGVGFKLLFTKEADNPVDKGKP